MDYARRETIFGRIHLSKPAEARRKVEGTAIGKKTQGMRTDLLSPSDKKLEEPKEMPENQPEKTTL